MEKQKSINAAWNKLLHLKSDKLALFNCRLMNEKIKQNQMKLIYLTFLTVIYCVSAIISLMIRFF